MRVQQQLTAALLAGALLAGVAFAQTGPPRTWSRTYGGAASLQGLFDVRQLPGGRLGVAGYTGSFGGPGPANWLLHLELDTGTVEFERASSSAAGGIADGGAVAADGGALFLGRDIIDLFIKHDAWVMRVDGAGNVVWSQGFAGQGAGKFFLFDAAELADGSWIAVGSASEFDFPPQRAWIVRLGSRGTVRWQFEYGAGIAETARAVTPTSDGGFAAAGWSNSSGAGSDDVWVMKVDAHGAILWQRTYGGFDADQAEDIVALADGGFAVVGSSNSLTPSAHAPWILRLDSTGGLLWHKVVATDVWGDLGAVAQTDDGQLVVVGRVAETGFPTNDLWSARLDAGDGSVAWQRAYEGELGDFGSAVLPLAGAGYVVGGTWGWGFKGESIWLERTDSLGGLGSCDIARFTNLALLSPPITVRVGQAVQVPATAQLQAVGAQLDPSAAVVTELCD
jgi:hypothetical protein